MSNVEIKSSQINPSSHFQIHAYYDITWNPILIYVILYLIYNNINYLSPTTP